MNYARSQDTLTLFADHMVAAPESVRRMQEQGKVYGKSSDLFHQGVFQSLNRVLDSTLAGIPIEQAVLALGSPPEDKMAKKLLLWAIANMQKGRCSSSL